MKNPAAIHSKSKNPAIIHSKSKNLWRILQQSIQNFFKSYKNPAIIHSKFEKKNPERIFKNPCESLPITSKSNQLIHSNFFNPPPKKKGSHSTSFWITSAPGRIVTSPVPVPVQDVLLFAGCQFLTHRLKNSKHSFKSLVKTIKTQITTSKMLNEKQSKSGREVGCGHAPYHHWGGWGGGGDVTPSRDPVTSPDPTAIS